MALLAPTQFPWNRAASDGSFLLDPIAPYDDAVFHVGLARELTLGLPPQVPGLSGVTLGYHFGQALVRAAALRFAHLEPFDLISRVDPVVLSLGLILVLRGLAARLGLPPLGVTLAGWSVLFTDFSFVFASNPSASYWADLLKGNLLLSLAYVNPVVPGLLLALGALAGPRALRGRRGPRMARRSRPCKGPRSPTSRSSWEPTCCSVWRSPPSSPGATGAPSCPWPSWAARVRS